MPGMGKRRSALSAPERTLLREWGLAGLQGQVGLRNASVARDYYGLFGGDEKTMAQLAVDHRISRERVRQIVANVRRKLGYVPEAAP